MADHPRRRATDKGVWARFSHDVISPGAAVWLMILSVVLLLGQARLDNVVSDQKTATQNTLALARGNQELATRLNNTLCTFVTDLNGRVRDTRKQILQTEQFIRDNPNGVPGIPVKLLRDSLKTRQDTLNNQRAAVRSFHGLHCTK